MKINELPERWLTNLRTYLRDRRGVDRDQPSNADFNLRECLKLSFDDHSWAFFYSAFYIVDREQDEVAVFTQHCGIHIFPLLGTKVEFLELKSSDR